ncbi:MAG TPA: DUF3343 domain-containing protein [Peptococcaceae bacterium]|nr:DUF3343 domain-containing protein [Peptococcaceae bacterium]
MNFLATFYTHSGAVKYHRYLQKRGIPAETMPVPRRFSSNCGIGVSFTTEENIEGLICEDVEKLFLLQEEQEKLIYENDNY